ncbi:MAG: SsrA-binding protein SmpB [Nitrospirota bacterium]|nr:SsrA-binding protein SmpB [Nitrospirota bacterium]
MAKQHKDPNNKVVGTNRKATFDYFVEEKIEAGLMLVGTEVKALREGHLNLRDSYASIANGKAVLHNCHIGTYSHGNQMNHEPLRPRTLLLHKKEIERLTDKVKLKGLTIVPLRLYFNDRGRAKLELAVARGKKTYDRRETVKKREASREIDRAMKESGNR